MSGSAGLLAVLGIAVAFAPDAAADALSLPAGAVVGAPLAAGGLMGFAAVNWVGRGAIYGGIYGRPIVLGNFVHAMVLATTLVSLQLDRPTALGWSLAAACALYLAAFTRLLLRPPFERD